MTKPTVHGHLHTYACLSKPARGPIRYTCGFPVGPEAQALLDAFNAGDWVEFHKLCAELEIRVEIRP